MTLSIGSHTRYGSPEDGNRAPFTPEEPKAKRGGKLLSVLGFERNIHKPEVTWLSAEERAEISEQLRNEPEFARDRAITLDEYMAYQAIGEPERAEEAHMHLMHMYAKVARIADAVTPYVPKDELRKAFEDSLAFLDTAFGQYSGELELDRKNGHVFAVPTRIERDHNGHTSEVEKFIPLARYVEDDIVQRAIVGVPPAYIEEYNPNSRGEVGHVMFVPLFADMERDLKVEGDEDATKFAKGYAVVNIINDAASFARRTNATVVPMGATRKKPSVLGLGAILPGLSQFGRLIFQDDIPEEERLYTTTGHGGTIHLIAETLQKIDKETRINVDKKAGILGGAGSIGRGTLHTLLKRFPDFKFEIADKRDNIERLQRIRERFEAANPANVDRIVVSDVVGVLENNNVIISAITGRIDLDELERSIGRRIDLTGKVIADDSQPGAFTREQVEARGGYLVWIVGEDTQERIVRAGGYSFGNGKVGMTKGSKVWGCEAEGYMINDTQRYDLCIRGPVTTQDVDAIGEAMTEYGIVAADFESFGRRVEIPRKRFLLVKSLLKRHKALA